jgi:hypothetical protein
LVDGALMGAMRHQPPPTADTALLAYLISVLAVVAAFALIAVWLMQPTVLPNGGVAAFEKERRSTASTALLARRAPEFDLEQSAIALAKQENEKQGLRPLVAASRLAQSDAPSKASSKVTDATPPRPPKPKRVARAHRPDSGPAPRNAFAYSPSGGYGPFGGGFGSWFR